MKDRGKTKEPLFKELKTLQGRLAKLERAETECRQAEEALKKTKDHLQDIRGISIKNTELGYTLSAPVMAGINRASEEIFERLWSDSNEQ